MKVLLENNKFLGSAARVGLVEGFLSQDPGVSDSSLIGVTGWVLGQDTLILA